ncbi:polyprenyl synthetase family protein [Candidatus Saccharibacteria bacterium]|nr:polyprenyl synthetase family protein [Candidatus Saccharibacteria bacterium]
MNSLDFGIKNLPRFLNLVDKKLKGLAPKNISGAGRLLHAHGKRLRPSLVIAIAFYNGKKIDDKVINAATAVELVHLASLVHDDIIDIGALRWGVPTINSKEGTNSAILAGDYLFAKGCALAANVSAEAGVILAETIMRLCEGQAIELRDNFNTRRTTKSLLSAVRGKTSSMFIASVNLGGLVSGLDSNELKVLSDVAENFGFYYQYMDDVRDFVESPETTGKSVGNDVREGNYTLPVILSLHGPNKVTLKKLLESDDVSAPQVLEILKKDDSINRAISEAENYKQKALLELRNLNNAELAKSLEGFINHF